MSVGQIVKISTTEKEYIINSICKDNITLKSSSDVLLLVIIDDKWQVNGYNIVHDVTFTKNNIRTNNIRIGDEGVDYRTR